MTAFRNTVLIADDFEYVIAVADFSKCEVITTKTITILHLFSRLHFFSTVAMTFCFSFFAYVSFSSIKL